MLEFSRVLIELEKYKKQYGDYLVPQRYVTEDGIRLGSIVSSIRTGNRRTSEEEKKVLNDVGFVWKAKESTLKMSEVIELLKEYKEEHGHCRVPFSYKTKKGVKLGMIVTNIRSGDRKTNDKEQAILDSIGFVWQVNK